MLPAGYTNAIFQYHKLVCREPAQNRIFVYDTDTGSRVKEITDAQSDVLLSNRGVVYKDLAENIYFAELERRDCRITLLKPEHMIRKV